MCHGLFCIQPLSRALLIMMKYPFFYANNNVVQNGLSFITHKLVISRPGFSAFHWAHMELFIERFFTFPIYLRGLENIAIFTSNCPASCRTVVSESASTNAFNASSLKVVSGFSRSSFAWLSPLDLSSPNQCVRWQSFRRI